MKMVKYQVLSEEEQLRMVREDGYAIEFIEKPSERVQLEALRWGKRRK